MILTDKLRKIFSGVIRKIARMMIHSGISANTITIIGCLGNVIAAGFISQGKLFTGGVIAGVNSLLDALDGAVAEEGAGITVYGSFLDSTLDRVSEYVLFLGMAIHFHVENNSITILMTFLAFGGSILVSYIRAKGDSLGISIKNGIMTRIERLFVLVVSLLFNIPLIGLTIITVLSNITAVQRFSVVKKLLQEKGM